MRLIEAEIQQLKFKILDMAELVQFQLDHIAQALVGDGIYSMASTVPALKELHDQKLMKNLGLEGLINATKEIVTDALMSYFNEDIALSQAVFDREVPVLEQYDKCFKRLVQRIGEKPELAESLVQLVLIIQHLRRMARLGVSIAEETIFYLNGTIRRHSGEKNPSAGWEHSPPDTQEI